ncbi:MAG: peptide-methionine (S)-S-oxide reductase MsrA [Bacteroidales bacterium]|nr:peptide-methionine (S)-S-oxide reductase MsrA [Bacteroidales bacterium]MBS4058513.1 peptide-methionine (S)-S-oxide reductase MsrA [Bacteroidales bacterium]
MRKITLVLLACIPLLATPQESIMAAVQKTETITLGAGCFWCVEAVFQRVNGVINVVSGYSGGKISNPTYKEVCSGLTGHAEVVQVSFDPTVISLTKILEIFWKTHDPTTLNRQGADSGTQYRSVIFYHSNAQLETASALKQKLDEAKVWEKPIVTEIAKFDRFYLAEDYHQEYFENNADQPYCRFVIIPKLEKFEKIFAEEGIIKKP